MSLFGGDAEVSEVESQSSQYSSTPPFAQRPQLGPISLDSDEDEFLDSHNGESSDPTDEDEASGSASEEERLSNSVDREKWLSETAEDRRVITSLDEVEAADLSAHLYNAHHLKRRAQTHTEELAELDDSHSKGSGSEKGRKLDLIQPRGQKRRETIPNKNWTAWPLPPDRLRAKNAEQPMKEEILALLLRQAKNKWLAPDHESTDKTMEAAPNRGSRVQSEVRNLRLDRPRSRSTASDVEMLDAKNTRVSTGAASDEETSDASDTKNSTAVASETGTEEDFVITTRETRRRKLSPLTNKAALLLVDDDEARREFQQPIELLLASLGNVARAIRRSRLEYSSRGTYVYRSRSGYRSDAEPAVSSRTRSSSRVRITKETAKENKQLASRPASGSESGSSYRDTGTSASEEDSSPETSHPPRGRRFMWTRPIEKNDFSSKHPDSLKVSKQADLMDWSEMLALASLTGWDEQAVARAARRCATLFDEEPAKTAGVVGKDFRLRSAWWNISSMFMATTRARPVQTCARTIQTTRRGRRRSMNLLTKAPDFTKKRQRYLRRL